MRGDYVNLTAIIDLTLSRLDTAFFTGTRWEGNLTELELQWGRTIGQIAQPRYIAGTRWRPVPPQIRDADVRLDRRIKVQLALFTVIAMTAGAVMIFHYIDAPVLLFGVGRYTVTARAAAGRRAVSEGQCHLPRHTRSVRSKACDLTRTGARAVLSLKSDFSIPSDLRSRDP